MTSIPELMKQIVAAEPLTKLDPDVGDPRSRIGRETLKHQGEETIKNAKIALREVLRHEAVFVVPVGNEEAVSGFTALAESEGAVVVSAAALYERLAGAFRPSMAGGINFSGHQEMLLLRELQSVMEDLEIRNMPLVVVPGGTTVLSDAEAINCVRTLVRHSMGDALNRAFLEEEIFKKVVAARYTGMKVLVVLKSATATEIAGLESGEDKWTIYAPKVHPSTVEKTVANVLKKVKP
jgi:hypothetical protein